MPAWSYKGANSIARYMVAVELATPLNPDVLKTVTALHPLIRDDLPRKVEQQAFTFQVGQPQPLANLGGVIFDSVERDGTVVQQMAIMPNIIFFMIINYTRWADFWTLAEKLMKPILQIAFQNSNISAVVLEANNRFNWEGPETEIDCSSLLQKNCPFISPNVITHKYLSHSFHGFARPDVNPRGRRIDNINFSLLDRVEDKNPADLIFNYRILFDKPISCYEDMTADELSSLIEMKFKALHDANNRRFMETIVPEIWQQMEGLST